MPARSTSLVYLFLLGASLAGSAACDRGQPAAGNGPAAGPPPAGVTLLTLESKPIRESSEFIASIRSLRSATIQPEVDGIVRRIFAKSGDRVAAGTPLVQIDAERQEASVRSLEATRAGTEADVEYWRAHLERLRSLVDAGAISRQEFEQAQTSLRTAEARLAALDAQLREGQVQLRYFRVTAPHPGIVGDIPVRPGDRVTTATVITTIDANDALEAHIDVPLERAPELRVGLPVELLDAHGVVVATNPVSFVAPRVDTDTQAVLAKVLLKDAPAAMRVQQYAKARVIWRTTSGVTIPAVAVTRVSSQYFCFVAVPEGDGLVARQRALRVGELQGDEYVVVSGVTAGERVIVSGIQRIGDGAPVRAE